MPTSTQSVVQKGVDRLPLPTPRRQQTMPVRSSNRETRRAPERGRSMQENSAGDSHPAVHNSIPPVPGITTANRVPSGSKARASRSASINPLKVPSHPHNQFGNDILTLIKGSHRPRPDAQASQAVRMNDPRERPTIPKGKLQPAPMPKVKSAARATETMTIPKLLPETELQPLTRDPSEGAKQGGNTWGAAIQGVWGSVADPGYQNDTQNLRTEDVSLGLSLSPVIDPAARNQPTGVVANRAGIGASGGKWANRLRERRT